MLNYVWSFLLLVGVLAAGLFGKLGGDTGIINAALKSSKAAVLDIALPLAGIMMLWLGILRVMEKAGLLQALANLLSPVLRRLFPDVPAGHPAMSAMVMNVAANMLGLGNAATPLGLKAMEHLQEVNPRKDTASNAMCMFLALNTAGLTLIPMGAINYLSAGGVRNPYQIIGPTLVSTLCATLVAIVAAKVLQRLRWFRVVANENGDKERPVLEEAHEVVAKTEPSRPKWLRTLFRVLLNVLRISPFALAAGIFLMGAAFEYRPDWRKTFLHHTRIDNVLKAASEKRAAAQTQGERLKAIAPAAAAETVLQPYSFRHIVNTVSTLAIPFIFVVVMLWGLYKKVPVYEEAVEGAKEGFQVATRIMPFLVIMLAALSMFRESGALVLLESALRPLLAWVRMPVELFPLAIMRPLSGSGSSGILNDIILYPGSTDFLRYTGAVMYGSTETTFYVLAVYFGSVGIRKIRHALAVGLIADVVGMVCAITASRVMFG